MLTFSGSVQNCKLSVTYHTKNTGILSLDITLSTTESSVEPKNAPPAGDKSSNGRSMIIPMTGIMSIRTVLSDNAV